MVQIGLVRLLAKIEGMKNRNIGLIANHTSVTDGFQYSWDARRAHGGRFKKSF
jgi:hypothetical protein